MKKLFSVESTTPLETRVRLPLLIKSRYIFLTTGFIAVATAQSADQAGQLPPQAKEVRGIILPVPKEIFNSLDSFQGANWRTVQRPETARWRSHGDEAQIATLLGVVVAEGFIAMEAKDSTEVKNIGNTVLRLSRGLGVQNRVLRRARSIMDHAEKGEWTEARQEWDGVLSDLEAGLVDLNSADLSQLVSLGGWLRGTEALCDLLLESYSSARAELVRQPVLLERLERQIEAMSPRIRSTPIVLRMLDGMRSIRRILENHSALDENQLRQIKNLCHQLVLVSSQRAA